MTVRLEDDAVRAIFQAPRLDGKFEGHLLQYAEKIRARQQMVVPAFGPKTGGTFLTHAAMYTVNGQQIRISYALGGRDDAFYLPNMIVTLLHSSSPPTVVHLHMQAHKANRHFLEAFDLEPVIMIRNIMDALASFWDMALRTESLRRDGFNFSSRPIFLRWSGINRASFS